MTLSVKNVCAWHGQLQVLWGVDLDVADGEVVGILGRNGAGKTTLLRTLARLHEKSTGALQMGGHDISKLKAHAVALQGLSLVRDGGRLPASLTVAQMIELGQRLARIKGQTPRALSEIWQWFPILEPLRNTKAGLLSGGQRQALALAAAFASRPRLLLLDEPSAGLSPPVASELFITIRNLAADGLTVIVVEQQAGWLTGLVKRGYLLDSGKVVATGSLQNLVNK
ncbi:ABC transporter ATP-binding protein [Pollutimonas bauzanensis]|uniref:Branched-chain amino acid transport system ATP-binding protein n=1 Tax=Pollutimonas bauzanensis TaxID=658167 RepID=A0A1M5QL30_9BURK|nr:ATP-binding cassette domain-containing protein [Pollutimonas bauzanensis]SHH14501.1 branched-chain amino acid transport system ATP-binding protein [Pollutimonas bauzanensis]